MSRHANPFIGQRAYNANGSGGTINLAQAGTKVFAPDLANIASNSPYVRRNVIPFLIEAPRFFQFHPEKDRLVASLRAFIETHTRNIDGLNQQLSVDSAQSPYGGSGEQINTPTNVTRAVSNPTHASWELQGRAISKFIKWWIQWGIGDENTKVPLITTLGGIDAEDYDITFFGATVLYVEPDPTFTDVVSAWLCTNMYPTATPPWEGSKDASQIGQNLEINIEFTATTDVSTGTEMFARNLLQGLNLAGMNPNENPLWFENISADVLAQSNGIDNQIREAAASRIAT